MSNQKKNRIVPRLRFPEFKDAGEWERKKLIQVCKINPTNNKLPIKFVYVDLESVQSGVLVKKNIILLKDAPSRAQRILKVGDIIFQMVRPYQKNNYFFQSNDNLEYVASTGYAQLRAHESNGYLYHYIHNDKFVNSVLDNSTGSNYPAINSSYLSEIIIAIPKSKEQQKIADCLTSIDELIKALSQKVEILKEHKKGLMQKLFPVEGNSLPQLRFPEFKDAGEWVAKEVGNVFEVTRGYVLSMSLVEKVCTDEFPYPVFSSQTKNNGISGYYSDFLYENAITWTTDGANAGDVNYRSGKFYCTNICGVLINHDGYANAFSAALINSVSRKYVSYVGNPKLMNGVMSRIIVPFPSLKEQQKIADCLTSLDELIKSESQKVETLEEHKKGLMQQLFPSVNEVVK